MKRVVLKNNVYGFRKKKNFTQKKLADLVGTTRETIGYIENNAYRSASVKLCLLISIALDCDINEIFWLEVEDYEESKR